MVNDAAEAKRVESLRFHGITYLSDRTRDVAFPGGKFNMPDVNARIGYSQLERLPEFLARRRALVDRYFARLATDPPCVLPPRPDADADGANSWNMFCVLLPLDRLTISRKAFRDALEPLCEHRKAQHMHVTVVQTTDVLGKKEILAGDADKLRERVNKLCRDAKGPSYVLLVGQVEPDKSEDADRKVLPPLRGTTSRMKGQPSDNAYGEGRVAIVDVHEPRGRGLLDKVGRPKSGPRCSARQAHRAADGDEADRRYAAPLRHPR